MCMVLCVHSYVLQPCICVFFVVPEAPLCHAHAVPGNTTAEVSWLPPTKSNGEITQYEVCIHTPVCSGVNSVYYCSCVGGVVYRCTW